MEAVSISQAQQAPPPQWLNTKTNRRADASPESTFGSQLFDAIRNRTGQSKDGAEDGEAGKADTPEAGKKKDILQQLPLIAFNLAAVLPTLPAGAFGMPTAGTDPGQSGEIETASQEGQSVLSIDTPTPMPTPSADPAPAHPDIKADLAFALKLDTTNFNVPTVKTAGPPPVQPDIKADPAFAPKLDTTTFNVPAVKTADAAPVQPDIKVDPAFAFRLDTTSFNAPAVKTADAAPVQPDIKVDPAFALKPDTTNFSSPATKTAPPSQPDLKADLPLKPSGPIFSLPVENSAPQPQPDAKPHVNFQPIRAAAASAQAAAPQQSNTAGSDTSSSEKESPKDQPKLERPALASPSAAAKTTATAGPAIPAANTAPASSPTLTVATVPSIAPRTASVTQSPVTEHVAAAPADVRIAPASSEVTDVSVTIPIPRADSAGDDRVAIRMVQRGTEIHVSVRTPDHALTQALRQDLGKLSAGLDQAGFRTESWRPVAAASIATQTQASAGHESRQDAPNHGAPGSGAFGGQNGRGARDQRRRQQDESPRWVAELEQYKNQ